MSGYRTKRTIVGDVKAASLIAPLVPVIEIEHALTIDKRQQDSSLNLRGCRASEDSIHDDQAAIGVLTK